MADLQTTPRRNFYANPQLKVVVLGDNLRLYDFAYDTLPGGLIQVSLLDLPTEELDSIIKSPSDATRERIRSQLPTQIWPDFPWNAVIPNANLVYAVFDSSEEELTRVFSGPFTEVDVRRESVWAKRPSEKTQIQIASWDSTNMKWNFVYDHRHHFVANSDRRRYDTVTITPAIVTERSAMSKRYYGFEVFDAAGNSHVRFVSTDEDKLYDEMEKGLTYMRDQVGCERFTLQTGTFMAMSESDARAKVTAHVLRHGSQPPTPPVEQQILTEMSSVMVQKIHAEAKAEIQKREDSSFWPLLGGLPTIAVMLPPQDGQLARDVETGSIFRWVRCPACNGKGHVGATTGFVGRCDACNGLAGAWHKFTVGIDPAAPEGDRSVRTQATKKA